MSHRRSLAVTDPLTVLVLGHAHASTIAHNHLFLILSVPSSDSAVTGRLAGNELPINFLFALHILSHPSTIFKYSIYLGVFPSTNILLLPTLILRVLIGPKASRHLFQKSNRRITPRGSWYDRDPTANTNQVIDNGVLASISWSNHKCYGHGGPLKQLSATSLHVSSS